MMNKAYRALLLIRLRPYVAMTTAGTNSGIINL